MGGGGRVFGVRRGGGTKCAGAAGGAAAAAVRCQQKVGVWQQQQCGQVVATLAGWSQEGPLVVPGVCLIMGVPVWV